MVCKVTESLKGEQFDKCFVLADLAFSLRFNSFVMSIFKHAQLYFVVLQVFDFELSDAEMKKIASLDRNLRVFLEPMLVCFIL